MVATFMIEIVLFVYTIFRYRLTPETRLVALIVLFLAGFQAAEYMVCGQGASAEIWARVGYVCITTLPVLGLHLIQLIRKSNARKLVVAAYASGIAWIALFVVPSNFAGHICGGNYVIFQLQKPLGGYYYAFYYFWLLLGIGLATHHIYKTSNRPSKQNHALMGVIMGYVAFVLPATVINTIYPSTLSGLPSIMCGFAVIFATILTIYVLPKVAKRR